MSTPSRPKTPPAPKSSSEGFPSDSSGTSSGWPPRRTISRFRSRPVSPFASSTMLFATPSTCASRARLELAEGGALSARWVPYREEVCADPRPVSLARAPVDRADVRLYHKCVERSRYDDALAAAPGMFDVLLWNADGEATELTRGNLVAELDGRCVTPPIDCGLLGGTLRAELLARGEIGERVITLDDVRRAKRLWFVNSLRGWVPIALEQRGLDGA